MAMETPIQSYISVCEDKPNCVSSTDSREDFKTLAIKSSLSKIEAISKLKRALGKIPRTKLVKETANYLHFEFKSFFFRFVDDVELLIDEQSNLIQIRSASRTGHSDLGVNKKRVEEIRAIVSKWHQI